MFLVRGVGDDGRRPLAPVTRVRFLHALPSLPSVEPVQLGIRIVCREPRPQVTPNRGRGIMFAKGISMKYVFSLATFVLGFAILCAPAHAALKVGAQAPDFTLPAYLAGEPFTFHLADALKKGPVVVYFFPAPHTSGCNLEAHLFSQAIDEFKDRGVSVIGVSAGNLDQMADFSRETEHCSGKFPVAADKGAKVAREYDSVLTLKPSWSNRTSYLIAPAGTVAAVYSALNPEKHVDEMLDAVKKLDQSR